MPDPYGQGFLLLAIWRVGGGGLVSILTTLISHIVIPVAFILDLRTMLPDPARREAESDMTSFRGLFYKDFPRSMYTFWDRCFWALFLVGVGQASMQLRVLSQGFARRIISTKSRSHSHVVVF